MVKQFSYTQLQVLDKASNEYAKAQDLIAEFELLLTEMLTKKIMLSEEQSLTFEHVLFFVWEWIAFHHTVGPKKIDVELPCASTCGLHLTLPTVDIKRKLVIAVNFGGGFGKV